MEALILVDIQHDFLPGGALAVSAGDEIIPVVNTLIERFSLVVATQDWHPAGHESFASVHPGKQPLDKIDLHGLSQVLWPDHCVQGTNGAAFSPAVHANKVAAIFRKGMDPRIDSYSGFFDNGYRRSTGMGGYLKSLGVRKVYLAGLAADYCVHFTAMDAVKEGFEAVVIEDATRPISGAQWALAKAELISRGGQFAASETVG